ncbi:MAG: hypothetical protein JSV86_17210 [Gemmatimonadota bacterium]|nr:MAG: hypothetical protein JSV86_17210 [Gemmatimonadota bacterium]
MQLTSFQTFNPPAAAQGAIPQPIARGTSVPVRALVRNAGATLIFLGGTAEDVVGADGVPSSATYRLPAGATDVFVLAPEQTLFAIGAGAGATIGVSVSEAIPLGQGGA